MIVNHLDHATIRPKLSFAHLHWSAMVVDLSIFVIPGNIFNQTWILFMPEGVHVGVDQDLDEGQQEVEDQPDVDHLDVGRFRQVVGDIDEHGSQHQHCLKKERISLTNNLWSLGRCSNNQNGNLRWYLP